MSKKIGELSPLEMAAARMLLDPTKKQAEIEKELGINGRTLRRRMKTPQFIAYQDQIRAQANKKLEKQTDAVLRKIDFSKADAVERLVEIARMEVDPKNVRLADQIKAIEFLANLLGWMAKPGLPQDPNQAADPEKPDVYRAAWMDRKPQ